MTPLTAFAAILALLLVALVIGTLLRRRGPRVRAITDGGLVDLADFGGAGRGAAGAVVQFSTEYCTRCPSVRRTLAALVEDRRSLDFVHVDVTDRPDLARKYRLLQTPTVLLVDAGGTPRARLSGPLSRAALSDALDAFTGGTP